MRAQQVCGILLREMYMTVYGVDRYQNAHGEVAIRLNAAGANRLLLALERLDQESGLEPALAQLRETLKAARPAVGNSGVFFARSAGNRH